MLRTARNMLDSVRVRLTAWYSAVLAVVLVMFSATTYLIVQKTSMQRTDTDLEMLADSFLVTFHAELGDATGTESLSILSAVHQAMIEHRTNSDAFVVLSPNGKIIATSDDVLSSGTKPAPWVAQALASDEFQRFARMPASTENSREATLGARPRLRVYSRQFNGGGGTY